MRPGKHALTFVTITVLLDVIGFSLIIPVLPALLVDLTGGTVSRAAIDGGWLAFVYAVMQFLFAPVLGNLSDRFGRRPVLLLAIAALGVDYVVMGLAPTLGWLFVGRAISGLAGASFTPAYAYVADITPPNTRAQSFGVLSAAFGVGFILGPALGGLLGALGPQAPFFAAATLSLLNFAYGLAILPESLPPERRRAFHWKRANALMSHRIAADAQGELQGAVAILYSLSSIVGPPLMAQLFGRLSAPTAALRVPGAAFLAAAALSLVCLAIYWKVTREPVPERVTASAVPS